MLTKPIYKNLIISNYHIKKQEEYIYKILDHLKLFP